MKTSISGLLFGIVALHAVPALAYPALVTCGGTAGSASIELDLISGEEGGDTSDQIVLRNQTIIDDFISKQAIYGEELDGKGEFIVTGDTFSPGQPFTASISNRHLVFKSNSGTSYTLTISYTASNFNEVTLADFTFNDCAAIATQ